jgi:hypothetical protein
MQAAIWIRSKPSWHAANPSTTAAHSAARGGLLFRACDVTDLSYAQVTDPSYPGLVSKGFLASANTLWPALEATLQREVLQGGVTSVTIAGHSLGAAMGTMLSYRAQVRAFNTTCCLG